MYGWGYRYLEQNQDEIGEMKADAKIRYKKKYDDWRRSPFFTSLGTHVHGAACPKPDLNHALTSEAGVRKRFCIKPPLADPNQIYLLRKFVREWLRENMTPISSDADTSVEHWLENTNYPMWRRQELAAAWDSVDDIWKSKYHTCNSFMKDESYPSYKHARAINSRSDGFKCAVGPIFKLIEEQVYKHPSFIKHVPVVDRPKYITEMLYHEGGKYYTSDYTAFESLFVGELMFAVEFELYRYMTAFLAGGAEFMRLCEKVLAGKNICKFRSFVVSLMATRMSGEMCTSLGNGFSNLMFMLFVSKSVGCTQVRGVVEGDDGLFTMIGTPPTKLDFATLGLVIKPEVHLALNTASFCGMVFDLGDQLTVTDPRKVLATLGWTSRQYARCRPHKLEGLLRCKALSLAHQYPGCPIVSALAHYVLRCTRVQDLTKVISGKNTPQYLREKYLLAIEYFSGQGVPVVSPPHDTRVLVETLYGITIEQQFEIEESLNQLTYIQPLTDDCILNVMPSLWRHYYDNYVNEEGRLSQNLDYPVHCPPTRAGLVREW